MKIGLFFRSFIAALVLMSSIGRANPYCIGFYRNSMDSKPLNLSNLVETLNESLGANIFHLNKVTDPKALAIDGLHTYALLTPGMMSIVLAKPLLQNDYVEFRTTDLMGAHPSSQVTLNMRRLFEIGYTSGHFLASEPIHFGDKVIGVTLVLRNPTPQLLVQLVKSVNEDKLEK